MSEFAQGVVMGVISVLSVVVIVAAALVPFYPNESEIICNYLGGEVQGQVCIKDNRVIPTDQLDIQFKD